MKLSSLRKPANIGVALFAIAATVLLGVIIASHTGFIPLAQSLARVAEPLSACAAAVLMYLYQAQVGSDKSDTEA